jgi:rubrerythrin
MNIANTNECNEAHATISEEVAFKKYLALLHACRKGNLPFVEQLLQDPNVDPAAYDNKAIAFACFFGWFAIARRLLKDSRVDPSAQDNQVFRSACNGGRTDIVNLLLQDPRVDPSVKHNACIKMACRGGHTATVEVLLSDHRVNPSAQRNRAMKLARAAGHVKTVELLLQDKRVARTRAKDNCLRAAAFAGESQIVKLLLSTARLTKNECVNIIERVEERKRGERLGKRREFEAVISLLVEHLNRLTTPQRKATGKRRASEVVLDNHDASLRKAPKLYKPTEEPTYSKVKRYTRLQDCPTRLCSSTCAGSNTIEGLLRKLKAAEKRREQMELREAALKRLREDEQEDEPSSNETPTKRPKQ